MLGVASEAQLPARGRARDRVRRPVERRQVERNQRPRQPWSQLAFSSRTPGRTQQINIFALRSGALVADLPGYGYAAVSKSVKRDWQDFLWQYVTHPQQSVALVLMMADCAARRQRLGLRRARRDFVPSGRPVLILATKADKLGKNAQREALAAIAAQLRERFPLGAGNVTVQLFSATTRQGVAEAETTIASWLPG